MGWVLLAVAAAVPITVLLRRWSQRRSAGGDLGGIGHFRKHMDALSSESRRHVIDRTKNQPPGGER
jgi:hypothetical protein